MKTQTHRFARTAMMLVLAMLTTNLWAQINLSQDGNGNYLIGTVEDWDILAEYVASGHDCANMTFLMTTNIGTDVKPVTKPIGKQTGTQHSDRKRFAGTFDGGNFTLTIDLNSDTDPNGWFTYEKGYCSPFAYLRGATIRNLHVVGTVETIGTWASGLVGSTGNSSSDGTCTIDHCQVSVAITTNYQSHNNKYGNHGGFIGIAEGKTTISNSWFDGKFLGLDYKYSAGFIGINKAAASIKNCLFNPSEINITNNNIEGSCEFVHSMHNGTHTLTQAYWVSHFGEPENAQGQRVYANKPDPNQYECDSITAADGATYYIIKGNLGWAALQSALTNGTNYTMTTSLMAGQSDAALVVPAGVNVTLDMKGFTIDRGLMLEPIQTNGYVIKVETGATLTIKGGTITGGNNNGNCGGIYNAGTLNINGITITGNYSKGHGAGIYNAGTLNIVDANITGNTGREITDRGLGVYVAEGGSISIQGNVQINNNNYTYYDPTVFHTPHNLYLGSAMITISDKLDQNASVSVEGRIGVITNGLVNNGNLSNFTTDDANYGLYEDGNEAKMAEYVNVTVNGYGNSTESDHWYFIASPLVDGINPANVDHLINSNHNYKDYDLYRFNEGTTTGDEWENYKNSDHADFNTFVNGQGYLYANKKTVTLPFLGNYNTNTTQDVDLAYTDGQEFAGWNLVGNPFAEAAYVSRNYYRMNATGTGIEAVDITENNEPIAAGMGIMVQALGENEKVTFSTSEPSKSGGQGNIQIAVAQANTRSNAMLDKAIVSFNEGSKLNKFYFGPCNANLYIPQQGVEYAIANAEKQGEMPVNFKAAKNGEYTLSVNAEAVVMNYLHLIDNMTGADIDLLAEPSYSFSAKVNDYASRFKLVFSADNTSNAMEGNEDFAYFSDGQIVLFDAEDSSMLEVMDMSGHIVFSEVVSRTVSTEGMAAGVYVLRLISGNNVKVQKMVIE